MARPDLYQIITIVLSIAIVIVVGTFIYNLSRGSFGKAALSVDLAYDKGAVLVNGKDKGETPVYTEEVKATDLKVQINGQSNSYSTIIKPAAGTLAVVKRDLGVNTPFSSGQNIWFTKSGEEQPIISVVSPDVSDVIIIVDGVEIGKSPKRFKIDELLTKNPEDKYTLTFKKDGYEDQEVNVKVKPGYELNIRTDMFLKPIPTEITTLTGLPEGIQFVNFSKSTDAAFTDRQAWAKAISYWLRTRGAATLGNDKVEKFDYFVSDSGKIYNSDGNEIPATEMQIKDAAGKFVAYLGSDQVSELTAEAKASLETALGNTVAVSTGGTGEGGAKVKIKDTGIGFLRVRSGAGTANSEVGRVDVGSEHTVLEESNGWYKIEFETGKQGWVSATYAEKL